MNKTLKKHSIMIIFFIVIGTIPGQAQTISPFINRGNSVFEFSNLERVVPYEQNSERSGSLFFASSGFNNGSMINQIRTNGIIPDNNVKPSFIELRSSLNNNNDFALNKIQLQLSSEQPEQDKDSKSSFFKSDLFYFVGAAALATTFYVIWSDNDKTVNKKTFGNPPKP